MKGTYRRWVLVCLAVGITAGAAAAERLRGFGEVTVTPLTVGELQGQSFTCESPERALVLLHKLGRDLEQSATVPVTWEAVRVGEATAPVLVRPGLGAFLLAAVGNQARVLTTTRRENLAAAFAGAAQQVAGARFFDPNYRYPVYLDKFSHYGIGSWYPQYWGDANTKDRPNSVDDHFAYARKYDLTLQPNGGRYLLTNLLPKIREYGRPYHFAQWQEWSQELARMSPEDLTQPGALFTVMPSYYGQVSEGGKRLLTYRNWDFQQTVRRYVDDPLLVDWLDPNGEVGPWTLHYYWDVSENNRRNFVRWLRAERGYTPGSLGEAWYGDRRRFRSWDEVPLPVSYDFFGWEDGSLQANREWRIHSGTLGEGRAAGYTRADHDDSRWPALDLPGGELAAMHWRTTKQMWYRGTLDVPERWLQDRRRRGRVYLNTVTLTTSGGWRNPDYVWVNGQELAGINHCPGYALVGQVDVTDVLRPGRNSVVYLAHNPWAGPMGPFFLTTKPYEEYPFSDSRLNARYYDWRRYVSWCIADRMEQTIKAIRGVDPNRFIKMHAAEDKYLGIPLQARYGAFGHNTGEGGFFRPWDKRFGYPRGVPASAEFGGGIETVEGLRRWMGWFTFEGLNAFDNFHNIQQMMYGGAADVWIEYLPYLKLANRRDLKKPDIALLWSSLNCHILPRPVPYCFDLGRGDLQSIGYSYVDVDEVGIKDGLAQDYPVLWDTGTWIMSPETVAQIRDYVEAGGTFVALQETGRHTFTQKDAWPIESLTGFRVREIRPMTGTLSILHDQPLFTKLAGKTFYNRGKSIDYSDYNYADKCVVLEPVAEGTQALARYADGTLALGMRTLGKGRVVVLGSPFWRDSYDGNGMWWPGEGQNAFLEDLLAGLGLRPLASSDSRDIWKEHYLATNGTEEYLALWNPFDTPRTFSVDWTTQHPASGLYDPKTGHALTGLIEGNQVRLDRITLAPLETLIVATQPLRAPQEAVSDWFAHLAWWWRPSEGGEVLERPDLPVYDLRLEESLEARLVSEGDLAGLDMAAISGGAEAGPGWVPGAGQSVEELRSRPDPARRVVFRCAFQAPRGWRAGDRYALDIRAFSYPGAAGPVDAYLNGVQVLRQVDSRAAGYGALDGGASADVSNLVKLEGENILVFVTNQYGFTGEVVLRRRPAPVEAVEIRGPWRVQVDEDGGVMSQELPGTLQGLYASKDDVLVPAAWQGSRVFLELELAEPADYDSFAVNGKVVFHPVNWYKPVRYMDITPWVRFGRANSLVLITKSATRGWTPGRLAVERITLEKVPPEGR